MTTSEVGSALAPELVRLAAAVRVARRRVAEAVTDAELRAATAAWTDACTRLLGAVRTGPELEALVALGVLDREHAERYLRCVECYDD